MDRIIATTFAISIGASAFYVFESGLPQPFLVILVGALMLFGISYVGQLRVRPHLSEPGVFFVLSLLIALVVDAAWYLIIGEQRFVLSAFQHVANLAVLVGCALLFRHYRDQLDGFQALGWVILAVKLLIVVAFILGIGRFDVFPRYNFFFNDPNQMAYWLICMSVVLFLFNRDRPTLLLLDVLVSLLPILVSMSRSGAIGFALYGLGVLVHLLQSSRQRWLRIILLSVIVLVGAAAGSTAFTYFAGGLDDELTLIRRFELLDLEEQLSDRGYLRILTYPEYIFTGAGNGAHERFGTQYEVHSTVMGILFHYGIAAFVCFFGAFLFCLKRANLATRLVLLAPLFYGLSTYGFRTPTFWVMIATIVVLSKPQNP